MKKLVLIVCIAALFSAAIGYAMPSTLAATLASQPQPVPDPWALTSQPQPVPDPWALTSQPQPVPDPWAFSK